MSETRKIAAIPVADVVGYSRLAGADEDCTLWRLRALRSDLIDPAYTRRPPSFARPACPRRSEATGQHARVARTASTTLRNSMRLPSPVPP